MVSKAESGGPSSPGTDTLSQLDNRDRAALPPGDAQPRSAPHDDDPTYEAVEIAVRETGRGRWFLAEYARRLRLDDTNLLLSAIARLGSSLRAASAEAAALQLEKIIHDGMARISAGRPELAADDPVPCLELISREIKTLIADLRATLTDILNDTHNTARDNAMSANTVIRLDTLGPRLVALEKSGDTVEACIALLAQVSAHMREAVARGTSADIPPLKAEQVRYFAQDEEIFEPLNFAPAAMMPAPQTALAKATVRWTGPEAVNHGVTSMENTASPQDTSGQVYPRPRIVFSRTAATEDLPLPDTESL